MYGMNLEDSDGYLGRQSAGIHVDGWQGIILLFHDPEVCVSGFLCEAVRGLCTVFS